MNGIRTDVTLRPEVQEMISTLDNSAKEIQREVLGLVTGTDIDLAQQCLREGKTLSRALELAAERGEYGASFALGWAAKGINGK